MLAATAKNSKSLPILVECHDSQLLTFFLILLFFRGWYMDRKKGELFPNTCIGPQVLIPNPQGHTHEKDSNIALILRDFASVLGQIGDLFLIPFYAKANEGKKIFKTFSYWTAILLFAFPFLLVLTVMLE